MLTKHAQTAKKNDHTILILSEVTENRLTQPFSRENRRIYICIYTQYIFFAVFVRIVHRWVSRHSKKKKGGAAGQLKVVELNYKTSPDYYSTTVVGPKPQSQNNKKQWNCRRGTVTYNIYKIVFAAVVLRLYLLPFKRGTIPSRYDPTQLSPNESKSKDTF